MMLAADLILCLAGTVAFVQDYPSPHGVEHVRITRAQHQDHIDSLPLDAPRIEEARAVFAGYTGDFEELIKAYKLAYLWSGTTSAIDYDAADNDLWEAIVDDQAILERNWQRSARELNDEYFDRLLSLAPPYEDLINRHRRVHLVGRALGQLIEYMTNTIFSEGVASDLYLVAVARTHGADDADAGPLAEYDLRFMPLVERIDSYIWRHSYERRLIVRAMRAAVKHGTAADREAAIREYGNRIVSGLQLAWDVRQLNIEFLPRIESQVPVSERSHFRTVAERSIHPYLAVETIESLQRRIDIALEGDGITDAQRSGLNDLRAAIDAERGQQLRSLGALYDATIDPEPTRRYYVTSRRVALFAQGAPERQEAIDRATALLNEGEARRSALEEAVAAWHARLDELKVQLTAIIGDDAGDGE